MITSTQIQANNTNVNSKLKSLIEDALKAEFARVPKIGEVITGTVADKESSCVYADLGVFGTGVVYGREFQAASDIIKNMKVGDEISAKVVDLENENGYIELSLEEAGYELAWSDLIKKKESGEILDVDIKEVNKGGLMGEVNGVAAFMPVSQLSTKNYPRVEGGDKSRILQEIAKFVGQKMKVKIIDANQRENKLIISEKEAQDNDLKKILQHFKVGDVVEGTVSGVVNFGVFVKFNSPAVEGSEISELEGLVHISELDWQLIENPADIFKVGDKIVAKVISLGGDKISLSIKALKKDPWENVDEKFVKDGAVKGVVTKLNPFGAFVRLSDDIQGLCHISEFGNDEKMRQTIEVGKEYDFHVQSISKQEHRMSLGFGPAKEKPAQTNSVKEV